MTTDVMIYADGLSKTFGNYRALDNVSFEVQRGEVVGFLGPNGAGKSTTMRILTCFISPTRGVAKVKGNDVFDDPLAVRRSIGYLPQRAPLYQDMTVWEYMKFAADMRGLDDSTFRKRMKKIIEVCGLAQSLGKDIGTLSHGYRQRVGLGQALVHDPPILILDEPTSDLDPNEKAEVIKYIKEIGKDHTILLSTHNLSEVEQACARAIIVSKGRVVADGTLDDIRAKSGSVRYVVIVDEKNGLKGSAPKEDDVAAALKAVKGVRSIKDIPTDDRAHAFEITGEKDGDLRSDLFKLGVEKGWIILELRRDAQTLEDVFRDLTRGDERLSRGLRPIEDDEDEDEDEDEEEDEEEDEAPARKKDLRTMPPTLTIAKRELGSYFNSPLAYVVICLTQILLGVLFFLFRGGFWQVDRASLDRLFEYAPYGLCLLVVPVVTMRLIAEEKSSGTLEMLITLPVKDWEVIIGKYLGALTLVLILIASTLLYPIMMFRWPWNLGPIDMRAVLSGYLGLVLMSGAAVGVGLMISAMTRSQVIAFFITFTVLFAFVFIGAAGDLLSASGSGTVFSFFSFETHVANFARGIIDTRSIVFFLSITVFSLMVAFRALESRKWSLRVMDKRTRAVTESSVYLVIVAAILIAANVLAFMVHRRFDVTKNERFTLSQGSSRLVSGLKRPITVKAYVTTGLAKLDSFVRDLDDLMKDYERNSGGKFRYVKVITKSEAEKTEAKDYGLKEAAFGEGSETGEDQASIAQGYMGLVFLYGDEKDVIPILSPDQVTGLEFWVSNKIREIRDKADDIHRKIGVLSGHDEIKLADTNLVASEGKGGPSMRSVIEQAFPFYKVEDVDLKGGDAEIADDIDALLITQAGKDYTDKELRRIDQFVMKGNKGLAVFSSAVNMKASDPKMSATLSTHNLEKLLSGYGIEMKKDAVLDWSRSIRLPMPTQTGGMVYVRDPAIVQVTPGLDDAHQMLDTSFVGFFRIEELSFPFPSTLNPLKDKQPNANLKVVARTTPNSWAETTDTVDLALKLDWKPKPPLDQHAIAIEVDGKLKSAFGAGNQDGIELPAESKEPSRVFVVSSSQFLANPFARAGNGMQMEGQMMMQMPTVGGDRQLQMISQPYAQKYLTNTILAFKNTLDWLTGDSDLVAASAKILGEPNLAYADITKAKLDASDDDASIKKKDEEYRSQRKRVQSNVQLWLILLAPLAFAGFGVFRWQMRERKRSEMKLLRRSGNRTMALSQEHKIYAALVVLAALGGGVYFAQTSQKKDEAAHVLGSSSANLPELKLSAEDLDKVTKLEIHNADKGDVTLEKTGADWRVKKPVDYPANQQNVKSLLDNLKDLKTKDQIEPGTGAYAEYQVDDAKAVHVVAYKGADKALDLFFGKAGGRGQAVRKPGVDGVFAANGYSAYLYTRDTKNWRDTAIAKLDDAKATKVEITNDNGAFVFKKDADTWSATFKGDKIDRFDDNKVKDMLRAYKALNAEDFGDGKSDADAGLDKPSSTVVITTLDSPPLKLTLGKTSTGESRYLKKDGSPQVYVISSWASGWAEAKADKFQKAEAKDGGAPPAGSAGAPPKKK